MIKLTAVSILSLFILTGCGLTPQGDAFRVVVKERGKASMAEGLKNAEWFICRGASVGAIEDRYGQSAELSVARQVICYNGPKVNIIIPKSVIKDKIKTHNFRNQALS